MNININPNSELHQSIVNVPDMVQCRRCGLTRLASSSRL